MEADSIGPTVLDRSDAQCLDSSTTQVLASFCKSGFMIPAIHPKETCCCHVRSVTTSRSAIVLLENVAIPPLRTAAGQCIARSVDACSHAFPVVVGDVDLAAA